MRILFMVLFLQHSFLLFSEIRTAFDIGTGKIKMQVAKVHEKQIEPLYCQAEQISFPNLVILDQENMITTEGQQRIVEIIKSLKSSGEVYGSTKYEAIATELFRKAENGLESAKNISDLTGVEIKVISPEEEGILSFLTIVQEKHLDPEKIIVLDIGSGSFQITCKKEDQFLVYSAPFGRIPTEKLVKNKSLSKLKTALTNVDFCIIEKIRDCNSCVIGIGAHPKHILKSKSTYDQNDLKIALMTFTEVDLDYSDLLLVKTIMESLSITQIKYLASRAGNTSGIFVLQAH